MYNENALNIMIITCDAIEIDIQKLLTLEDIFDYDKFEKANVKSKVRRQFYAGKGYGPNLF